MVNRLIARAANVSLCARVMFHDHDAAARCAQMSDGTDRLFVERLYRQRHLAVHAKLD